MELANVLCCGTNHREPRRHGEHRNVGMTPSTTAGASLEHLFCLRTIEYLLRSRTRNVCGGTVQAGSLCGCAMLMYESVVLAVGGDTGFRAVSNESCGSSGQRRP